MEQAAKDQLLLSKQIKTLQQTYYQLAEERRSVKLINERIHKLDDLWKSFEEKDETIRLKYGTEKSHFYFTEELYQQVESLYTTFREDLMKNAEAKSKGSLGIDEPSNKIEALDVNEGRVQSSDSANTTEGDDNSPVNEQLRIAIRSSKRSLILLQRFMDEISLNNKSKEYYETKIQGIENRCSTVQQDDREVCSKHDDPDKHGYNRELIHQVLKRAQDLMIQLKEKMNSTNKNKNNDTSFNIKNKLPAITIPTFDGAYSNWMQFRDIFTELIHKQTLPNVEKMFYLKANVQGEAEALIRHLTICEDNYFLAWKILSERYNNKRLLVSTIIEKFLNQPNLIAGSAKSLKNMYDVTKECVLLLENWGLEIDGSWDPIMLQILLKKLDKDTHSYYEQSLKNPKELQSLQEFLKFIEMKFQSLEAVGSKQFSAMKYKTTSSQKASSFSTTYNPIKCPICGNGHLIISCQKFTKMTVQEREAQIRKLNLCLNCFRFGHQRNTCFSRGCKKCEAKHNTMLHKERTINQQSLFKNSKLDASSTSQANSTVCSHPTKTKVAAKINTEINQDIGNVTSNVGSSFRRKESYVFLGTALVSVTGADNKQRDCRVLLDSGSQVNFITEKLQKQLKLDTKFQKMEINGIGNLQFIPTTDRVNINVQSKVKNFNINIDAQVIKNITSDQPQRFININDWNIPKSIKLADPNFNQPQRVDMLLGAEMYGELMQSGQIRLQQDLPMLQDTVFGWIVLGRIRQAEPVASLTSISNQDLEDELIKFWECEEIEEVKPLTKTEQQCEEFFKATTKRNNQGRFIVNLPILVSPELLGESRHIALRRFINLENKLSKNLELKKQYTQFMDEYYKLGHMKKINETDIPKQHCFLPHHCVIKEESSTTKLRVVFDASAKTSSGLSLNDIMMKGPKTQDDLFNILLRFRTYKYVITADIKQMYRQIQVNKKDQKLQLIMWRSNPKNEINFYQLTTVTYGTRSAPYLATRCLNQLAADESVKYPMAAQVIQDFYVDDIITGGSTLTEAIEIKNQLRKLLKSAQLELHKWASNDERLLLDIPKDNREKEKEFSTDDQGYIKTLGLSWQHQNDIFSFKTTWVDNEIKLTKRKVVSETARLFDPLGLVNPIIVIAKIYIQKLWKSKVDWDEELNHELQLEWNNFRERLIDINKIKISRYVGVICHVRAELHMFGDASEKAYGAAAYLRFIDSSGTINCKLFCSKSKVAPVKLLTLPRLELCAARLATKLANKIKSVLKINIDETYLWSDSQIVLSWIKGDPGLFKTYVAHRIAYIHEKTKVHQWKYVNTKDNPADLLSRGIWSKQTSELEKWFYGPQFLQLKEEEWPQNQFEVMRLEEEERKTSLIAKGEDNEVENDHPLYKINHRNSYNVLLRTMAYVLRFIGIMKKERSENSSKGCLTVTEMNDALSLIIKVVQKKHYSNELKQLQQSNKIAKNSKISSLTPFLDTQGIIRVGGRLDNASISYDAKYPIVLPGEEFLSKLIIEHLHKKHFHAGPLALFTFSRQKFWITQGRNVCRAVTRNCIKCARSNPQLLQQIMGNLPSERVLPSRPFSNTGVDFCGPIWTHYLIRGKRPQKSYIAVFCCFATKAIHMEVVSDLTSDAFIGALKRFVARRGLCENIFCDNATNFVGAKNKLDELKILLSKQEEQNKIINSCGTNNVQFHFAPPRSPHFGGLWEAAVKSAKKLLFKTLASASLTFEELNTMVAEAEAVLNSRPLTPFSCDPNDLTALTPGHFLVGDPLIALPQPNMQDNKITTLSRWKLVSALRQEFWKRWHIEYLSQLQQRYKWKEPSKNVYPGMMVIIKDENAPPLKWPLGRVEEIIKGEDGFVRVVTIRTASGVFKRAIHNIAPIPIEDKEQIEKKEENKKKKENAEIIAPNKRRRIDSPFSATMFLYLTILFLPLLALGKSTTPFNVTTLQPNGAYFEKVGSGKLIATHWNLVVYHNMSNYWYSEAMIMKGLTQMKDITNKIKNADMVKLLLEKYEHKIDKIQERNQLLFNNISHYDRKKRGLINVVGNIANKLFGVLDDEYAEKIENVVKNLEFNQKKALHLIHNQTYIIEATTNLLKKNEEERNQHLKIIQDEIEEIQRTLKFLLPHEQEEKVQNFFLMVGQYLMLIIDEFQEIQTTMLHIMRDAQHGKFNTVILTPNQIAEHLEELRQIIPTEQLNIPSLIQIYGMTSISAKFSRESIIFVINIPLLRTMEFEIYNIVSFPVKMNNSSVEIIPNTKYIMANLHRDTIYPLSKEEFSDCVFYKTSGYLCNQLYPLLTKSSTQLECEIQLLTQQTISDKCTLKISKSRKAWIPLYQKNAWLFSLHKQNKIDNLVCHDQAYSMKLPEAGLLKFYDDCILKDDEFIIESFKRRNYQVNTPFDDVQSLPEFNFTFFEVEHVKQFNVKHEPYIAAYGKIKQQLQKLKEQDYSYEDNSRNDTHHYITSYLGLTIAIISFVLIIRFLIKFKNATINQQATIAPATSRQQYHLDALDINAGENVN